MDGLVVMFIIVLAILFLLAISSAIKGSIGAAIVLFIIVILLGVYTTAFYFSTIREKEEKEKRKQLEVEKKNKLEKIKALEEEKLFKENSIVKKHDLFFVKAYTYGERKDITRHLLSKKLFFIGDVVTVKRYFKLDLVVIKDITNVYAINDIPFPYDKLKLLEKKVGENGRLFGERNKQQQQTQSSNHYNDFYRKRDEQESNENYYNPMNDLTIYYDDDGDKIGFDTDHIKETKRSDDDY